MRALILFTLFILAADSAKATPNSFDLFPEGKVAEGAIAMGFVSKEMCSCLFVEKNTREYCDNYIMIKGLEEINFKVKVDMTKKQVRASTSFVVVKKAKYIDAKRGCTQTL